MGNPTKRGFRSKKKRNGTLKRKMSDTTSTGASESPSKNTRNSGCNADSKLKAPATTNKVSKKKQLNAKVNCEDLEALKAEFQKDMVSLKKELQEGQTKYETQLLDSSNKIKKDYEELKIKYMEKKDQIVSMQKEMDNQLQKYGEQKEEIERVKKQYQDSLEQLNTQHANSLLAIKNENSKRLTEIDVLQQNVDKLTKEFAKSKNDLICKEKEHSVSLESIIKKYEEELKKQTEEHERVISNSVSKDDYNYLYHEYQKYKDAFEENQRKLSKVIADKRMVEKSKLEVIRQKEHQKDEILDYVMNQNRDRRNYPQPDTKFPYSSKFYSSQSKFGRSNYHFDDDFAKRPRRH